MHVEFFGIPRERAGVSELEVDARTLGELLDALAARFPELRQLITRDGLDSSVAANLNGDLFVRDRTMLLAENDHVLLLSADAGG
jgi:molybdopterin converting factor small subunit